MCRLIDFIVLPDGRKVSPHAVAVALGKLPEVRLFQVVQEEDGQVRVRIVPDPSGVDDAKVQLVVGNVVGSSVSITIEHNESIPCEPNGKFKQVKSMISAASVRSRPLA
jgi:hypothetical protein